MQFCQLPELCNLCLKRAVWLCMYDVIFCNVSLLLCSTTMWRMLRIVVENYCNNFEVKCVSKLRIDLLLSLDMLALHIFLLYHHAMSPTNRNINISTHSPTFIDFYEVQQSLQLHMYHENWPKKCLILKVCERSEQYWNPYLNFRAKN